MFGYIHPLRAELKCKDWDLYKATYCGLCCTLREDYGLLAPLFLSYDMTFLVLLLEEPQEEFQPCLGRCHGVPWMKKTRSPSSQALHRCSDISMILTYFKLKDTIADEGFWKRSGARLLLLLLWKPCQKAQKKLTQFAQHSENCLQRLSQLEHDRCDSIDKVADCFASILELSVGEHSSPQDTRCIKQVLYHVGRWIYLMDAYDDYAQDIALQRYNPLQYRYEGDIPKEEFAETLHHSLYLAQSAFQLLEQTVRSPLLENILCLGMTREQEALLCEQPNCKKKKRKWRLRE